jgi:tRNA(adenine34) deaminase
MNAVSDTLGGIVIAPVKMSLTRPRPVLSLIGKQPEVKDSQRTAGIKNLAFIQRRQFPHCVVFSAEMSEQLEFMEMALQEARASAAAGEVPIGAVLVRGNEVLARGGNRTIRDCDPTAHAEIVVLREAARRLGNYRLAETGLYVTLEPCAMCAGAIVQARVSKLIYGADDPKGGAFRTCFQILTSPKLNHQVEVTPGVLAEEAASLLQAFFSARR